jgi:prepilin-type N-terminal cleavage/methylation domain-containing protein
VSLLRANGGFSLPEVLVAVAVFGIMAAGTSSVLVLNVQKNRFSKERTAATTVAQSRIEQFRTASTAPTASNDTVTIDNLTYNRSWTVSSSGLPSGVSLVTVAVTWREPSGGSVQLASYVTY